MLLLDSWYLRKNWMLLTVIIMVLAFVSIYDSFHNHWCHYCDLLVCMYIYILYYIKSYYTILYHIILYHHIMFIL